MGHNDDRVTGCCARDWRGHVSMQFYAPPCVLCPRRVTILSLPCQKCDMVESGTAFRKAASGRYDSLACAMIPRHLPHLMKGQSIAFPCAHTATHPPTSLRMQARPPLAFTPVSPSPPWPTCRTQFRWVLCALQPELPHVECLFPLYSSAVQARAGYTVSCGAGSNKRRAASTLPHSSHCIIHVLNCFCSFRWMVPRSWLERSN